MLAGGGAETIGVVAHQEPVGVDGVETVERDVLDGIHIFVDGVALEAGGTDEALDEKWSPAPTLKALAFG